MDQVVDLRSLRRVAPVAAALAGCAAALLIAVLPEWRLESLVASSGVADHLAAARPPLGATARSVLALASGGGVALLVWAALAFAAIRTGAGDDPVVATDAPVLRRADAHPDAPARRPLRASEDLAPSWRRPLAIGAGEPPASVPAATVGERVSWRPVPADLDTPLAAVDPAAIPDVPREPVRPVAPLARLTPTERFETFELTPIRRSAPAAVVAPTPTPGRASLAALLDRLEQGSVQRPAYPAPLLAETLGMLRGLATR